LYVKGFEYEQTAAKPRFCTSKIERTS